VIHFPKQAAIAASLALVLFGCGGVGTYAWTNPISYVSLDINPSISYSLNEFNRVIAVDGMNDEGTAIVDAIGDSLKNRDLTTALTITVEQLSTEAYLDAENTNYMVIGVYSNKDSRADALMSTVDAFSASAVDVCSITTVNVSPELMETADSYGITGGKMALINEITTVAADPAEVDPAVLAELTVAELEQTKVATAGGTSLADAVAAVSTGDTQESTPMEATEASSDSEEAVVPAADSNVVASEAKPEDADSSSSKKDESASGTQSASSTAIDGKDATDHAAASGSSVSPAASTDKNGTSSSDKKNKPDTSGSDKNDKPDASGSDTKGETITSESKGDGTSSPSKGETTSSESKGDVTEDDSHQTDTDLDPAEPALPDAIVQEVLPDGTNDETDEIDVIGIPS
jgi:hypothetical protein